MRIGSRRSRAVSLRTNLLWLALAPPSAPGPALARSELGSEAPVTSGTLATSAEPAPGTESTESEAPLPAAFSISVLERVGIGSENGTGWPVTGRADGNVDWQTGPFSRVNLVVDLASTCYPFESWAANLPPPGQNFPANCDAFDRNFNVLLDAEAPGGEPPFELIHAITPFGGPLHLEVDLTDLANARPGAHRLRAHLESFSDGVGLITGSNGGWTVSARVDVVPGPAPRRVLAAVPLLATQVTSAGSGVSSPLVTWNVPEGTLAGRLEYRTSGHGQGVLDTDCIGPAEEFCSRLHGVRIDGIEVETLNPIRVDCDRLCTLTHFGPVTGGFDYCLENPMGLPASVRAPRANWCPGSMTPPFVWEEEVPALQLPGAHTLQFSVSRIAQGGSIQMSATFYAYAAQR